MAKGHFINLQFKRFNLADSNDFVQITDGDGTFLGHFGPQHWSDQSGNVSSFTETVHVLFHTDQSGTEDGWELEWSKYNFQLVKVTNYVSRFISIVG